MQEFKIKTERKYLNTKISTVIQGEGGWVWGDYFGMIIFLCCWFFSMSIYHFNHLKSCLNIEGHPKRKHRCRQWSTATVRWKPGSPMDGLVWSRWSIFTSWKKGNEIVCNLPNWCSIKCKMLIKYPCKKFNKWIWSSLKSK